MIVALFHDSLFFSALFDLSILVFVQQFLEKRNTERFLKLRSDSPAMVLGKYFELNGMLASSRQACGHSGVLNLDHLHALNEKIEREERDEREREMWTKGHRQDLLEEKKQAKKENLTRVDIYNQAAKKARASAKTRMREIVMRLQSSEIEFTECPICLDAVTEKDLALTVRHHCMFWW